MSKQTHILEVDLYKNLIVVFGWAFYLAGSLLSLPVLLVYRCMKEQQFRPPLLQV